MSNNTGQQDEYFGIRSVLDQFLVMIPKLILNLLNPLIFLCHQYLHLFIWIILKLNFTSQFPGILAELSC